MEDGYAPRSLWIKVSVRLGGYFLNGFCINLVFVVVLKGLVLRGVESIRFRKCNIVRKV